MGDEAAGTLSLCLKAGAAWAVCGCGIVRERLNVERQQEGFKGRCVLTEAIDS